MALVTRELMLAAKARIQQAEQLLGVEMEINTSVPMSETDTRLLTLHLEKQTQG